MFDVFDDINRQYIYLRTKQELNFSPFFLVNAIIEAGSILSHHSITLGLQSETITLCAPCSSRNNAEYNAELEYRWC